MHRDKSRNTSGEQRFSPINIANLAELNIKKDDIILAFIIPVISRQKASDWQGVELNLARTVESILYADLPQVLVLIAHDEKPGGEYWGNDKVISIALSPSTIQKNVRTKLDKSRKIKAAACWLRQEGFNDLYIMFLDADDLVSTRLIKYVISNDNKAGYSITNGYVFDLGQNNISTALGGFHEICGSCFIGFFSSNELPNDYRDSKSIFSQVCDAKHRDHAKVAIGLGKQIVVVRFPAVVYVINHVNSSEHMRTGNDRTVSNSFFRRPSLGFFILKTEFGTYIRTHHQRSSDIKILTFVKVAILKMLMLLILKFKIKFLKKIL